MYGKRKARFLTSLLLAAVIAAPISPVFADEHKPDETSKVRVFEIDMNNQNPLATLKEQAIRERADYDAAINLNEVDFDKSTIHTSAFNRTKSGIQNISVSIQIVRKDDSADSVVYSFSENAAVKLIASEGPQVILKQSEVTVDLGSEFKYGDNIGYVSSTVGKLPVIKETDNVDMNTEGTYTCWLTFVDDSGDTTKISYLVNVRKPAEVTRSEEEAAQAEAQAEELASSNGMNVTQAAALQSQLSAYDHSGGASSGSVSDTPVTGTYYNGDSYVSLLKQWVGFTWEGKLQCVGYMHYRFAQHYGFMTGKINGNGRDQAWGIVAASSSWSVHFYISNSPAPGAIFSGVGSDPSGHTAFVEKVDDNGLWVSEAWGSTGQVNENKYYTWSQWSSMYPSGVVYAVPETSQAA